MRRAVVLLALALAIRPVVAEEESWSFAVLADPRSGQREFRRALAEIRRPRTLALAEVLLVAGDIDPIKQRHRDVTEVFAGRDPALVFLPVVGNHDLAKPLYECITQEIVPAIPGVVVHPEDPGSYHVDHRDARFVVIDGYHSFGKSGVINAAGRKWAEAAIRDAPAKIRHVFVSFHEPAFPRHRHLGDSFNADPAARDAFWNMLLAHRGRVRAVFVGHTHRYCRMRVADPRSKAANDPQADPPDEAGGIYQVDAGAAGNGPEVTVVHVTVAAGEVAFTAMQAKAAEPEQPFRQVDAWTLAVE